LCTATSRPCGGRRAAWTRGNRSTRSTPRRRILDAGRRLGMVVAKLAAIVVRASLAQQVPGARVVSRVSCKTTKPDRPRRDTPT
jgi:hypothetical protein